jgi:hypothetical protein
MNAMNVYPLEVLIFFKLKHKFFQNPKGFWDCNMLQINNSDEEYDNMAVAYRDSEEELFLIFQDFNEIKVTFSNVCSAKSLKIKGLKIC